MTGRHRFPLARRPARLLVLDDPWGVPSMPAVPAVPEGKGARLSAPVGLAIALTALFALVIGFDAYAVYADWNVRALADRALADPSAAVYADLERGYGLMDRAGTHQRRIAILTGIVFVVWFHRTRTNAEAFAPGADRLRPGWAIGGWFVPLANFWLPYRIAVATWGSSTPLAGDGGRAAGRLPLMPVNLWWGSFVLSKVVAWYGGRSYGGAESSRRCATRPRRSWSATSSTSSRPSSPSSTSAG